MTANAAEITLDDFSPTSAERWSYVADGVMGGVSKGAAEIGSDAGEAYIRLTGQVSTENNGGFIQVRRRFDKGLPENAKALKLRVRGNGETYYVFLRSRFATRPWHSYRRSFQANTDWSEITLPISSFEASHSSLPERIDAVDVTGIGLVAYGADFEADLSVSTIVLE
ncbi:MAG: CIA30 family protein [Pseudomonadota bacterium]